VKALPAIAMLVCCPWLRAADPAVPQGDPVATPAILPSLPAIPQNHNGFHAYSTRLNYTDEWEKPWRIGPYTDVVVRFPNSDAAFLFWHGANYIPQWVTENGIWYNNQFVERSSVGIKETSGCVEPMSDKQCRYSQVRIIQDNAARKIIHWRYAPVDVEYRHPYVDPATGWYDWVDEYYFLYPDAVATREATLYSTEVNAFADWQESIVVHQPGRCPEDNIETAAVSIGNLQGVMKHYDWPETSKKTILDDLPDQPCLQVVNLKSKLKPFLVIAPDAGLKVQLFDSHARNSMFRWWNHWPVSQDKSWSRNAKDSSKPSCTSLTFWKGWKPVATTDHSQTMVMLHGMSDQPAERLLAVAKAWLRPAPVTLKTPGATFDGFDRTQRAYVFTLRDADPTRGVEFDIAATPETPLHNPAFVIHRWQGAAAKVVVSGGPPNPAEIRQAVEFGLKDNSLVVWLSADITTATRVAILVKHE
jgi:hypothetical protein